MQSDENLADIMGEFASTMVTDFPIQRILEHLVARIVELMPVTGAGVTLVSISDGPNYLAASSASSEAYERLQSNLGEGPCVESCSSGQAVIVPDLCTEARFPAFTREALRQGLAAVFAFPLCHNDIQLGVLDLYRDTPGTLDDANLKIAATLADVAASYLINATARADLVVSQFATRHDYMHHLSTTLADDRLAWSALHATRYEHVNMPVDARHRASEARDATADVDDDIARTRDEIAMALDRQADARVADDNPIEIEYRAYRATANNDRQAAAADRTRALHDRVAAGTDREYASRELAQSLIDELTGAHRRWAGLMELEREADRAQRAQTSYALAFIDVDDLKGVNDTLGHAAGDKLLVDVVGALRSRLRPYDLVVRYGGDEFLCGLPDVELEGAAQRIALVNYDLSAGKAGHVSAGLARLSSNETVTNLIRRADEDLYRRRQGKKPLPELDP